MRSRPTAASDRQAALLSDLATLVARTDAAAPGWQRWRRTCLVRNLTRPIYALYGRRLLAQVMQRPPPRHVGIILDGNRRFGRLSGVVDPLQVYAQGAQKLDDLLDWCGELSIPAVTLWVCSTDNLARQPQEVAGILGALEVKLRALVGDPQIHRRRVRVQAIGRLELLPDSTVAAIRAAEAATADYDTMLLSIAVAYGGREEIADAVREMLTRGDAAAAQSLPDIIDAVCPERIGRHLYLAGAPEPDLIIRTSGELRLSGFLLWQSAYSEFYFSDVLWPAFRKIDFLRAVRAFQQRTPPLRPLTQQVAAQPRQIAAQEGAQRTLQQLVLALERLAALFRCDAARAPTVRRAASRRFACRAACSARWPPVRRAGRCSACCPACSARDSPVRRAACLGQSACTWSQFAWRVPIGAASRYRDRRDRCRGWAAAAVVRDPTPPRPDRARAAGRCRPRNACRRVDRTPAAASADAVSASSAEPISARCCMICTWRKTPLAAAR